MIVAGLDYSMTSPAICLYNDVDGDFTYSNCRVYFLTQTKKYDIVLRNGFGKLFEFRDDMDRYEKISNFFIERILEKDVHTVFIENYSMGSKGRVFNIAENTGILKYRLWKYGIGFETVPPTVIKKFATGKGNADKEKMQTAFFAESNIDLKFELNMTEKQWNPSSDIIDAYWICKDGYNKIRSEENEKSRR